MPLTNGLEPHAQVYPSPDGKTLLVTGRSLRLYTADGTLLHEIAAPAHMDVATAAWAPDGSGFVYIVGPEGFFRI